jgi:hypothetical protein
VVWELTSPANKSPTEKTPSLSDSRVFFIVWGIKLKFPAIYDKYLIINMHYYSGHLTEKEKFT